MPNETPLMPWHKHFLVNAEYDRVDLVKEGANSQAHIKLFKSKGGTTMPFEDILKGLKPEHREVVEKHMAAIQENADAAIAKAKADAEADAQEAIAKAKNPAANSEEEILKSIKDPAVRMLMETQIAKTKAAEDLVRAANEQRDNTEAIAKAKEVPNIGAEESQLSSVYKQLKAVNPVLAEDVFGIFKAASALIGEGGAFTEMGSGSGNQDGDISEDVAWGKIEAAAEVIAKGKNITKSAALSQAIKENPALYTAYLAAQNG